MTAYQTAPVLPLMTVRQLCERLELDMAPSFVERLGYKAPLLTTEFPAICDALIAHITTKKGA